MNHVMRTRAHLLRNTNEHDQQYCAIYYINPKSTLIYCYCDDLLRRVRDLMSGRQGVDVRNGLKIYVDTPPVGI